MKYEIKQLNNTEAVVISDEKIEVGDWFILFFGMELPEVLKATKENSIGIKSNCKKVIATISPFKIEGLPMFELPNPAYDWFASKSYLEQHNLSDKYFESRNPSLLTNEQVTEMYKLELPSQEDDIKKLALDFAKTPILNHKEQDLNTEIWISGARQQGFRAGYKAAQKQYNEEDMKKAIEMAREGKLSFKFDNEGIVYKYTQEEIIQSLQKKQFPTSVELTEDLQIIKWYYETES